MSPITLAVLTLSLSSVLGASLPSNSPLGLHHGRILGGRDAEVGEYPYQVSYNWGSLTVEFEHMCGAAILSPTWVITAGHCATQIPEKGIHTIYAGITDIKDDGPNRQGIEVLKRVPHPDYNGGIGPNDIALFQLESPLEFNDLVQPISLPLSGIEVTGEVTLTGWGVVNNDSILPILAKNLQTIDLPILPIGECENLLDDLLGPSADPLDAQSNICTGPLTGDIGVCARDNGSPLVQNGTLVGVVTWMFNPCGQVGLPSVYTNVASFIDFIKENVDDLP